MSRYKINVLTLQGVNLRFTVSKYEVIDGDFIEFIDEKTGRKLNFHSSRCEIEEVKDGQV